MPEGDEYWHVLQFLLLSLCGIEKQVPTPHNTLTARAEVTKVP